MLFCSVCRVKSAKSRESPKLKYNHFYGYRLTLVEGILQYAHPKRAKRLITITLTKGNKGA